jgi:hypothetical protein
MELNEGHNNEIGKYVNFFTGKKKELVDEIDILKSEFLDDMLNEDFYNREDINGFIDEYTKKIKDHVAKDMTLIVRISGVYVQQALLIAEKSSAQIDIDINFIEDAKLASKIGELEGKKFDTMIKKPTMSSKLAPVGEGNDMQDKIIKMTRELEKLKEKNIKLQSDLVATHKGNAKTVVSNVGSADQERLIDALKEDMADKDSVIVKLSNERDTKISDSQQVQNLKKMLMQKSDMVKQLKNR